MIRFLGDLNGGAIAAAVIVALLAIALLCFGLWYAKKKGYLPSKFLCLHTHAYIIFFFYTIS